MYNFRPGLGLAAICCLTLLLGGCNPDSFGTAPIEFSGHTMGTTYSVKLIKLPHNTDAPGIGKAIATILARLNAQMSTYDSNSDVSRFNDSHSTDWFPVSGDVCTAVLESLRVSRLSDGAFDITVGPLVNLWGFGPTPARSDVPKPEAIQKTMRRIGYKHLQARCDNNPALRKDQPDVAIDLSSIGHGYGSDKVADYLDSLGVQNYLVDVDSDMRGRGVNQNGQPWRIGIEKPIPGVRDVQRVVYIKNATIATSGTYRNFFAVGSKQYPHLLDPKTGFPIEHGFISVTVMTDKVMTSSVLGTALSVMGPETGYALAVKEGLAVVFLRYDGKSTLEQITPQMAPYLKE